MKKARCYNCKHSSKGFKISNLTHHTCLHPKHEDGLKSGELHPFDTLMVFSDSCKEHEFKNPSRPRVFIRLDSPLGRDIMNGKLL